MEVSKGAIATFCPDSRAAWRQWLEDHHASEQAVWLVYYKVAAQVASVSANEAVDEALCFGWTGSTPKVLDQDRYIQCFSKRKAESHWSKKHKERVARLIRLNLMARAGMDSVAVARRNGSWFLSDDADKLIVPWDLLMALNERRGAMAFFQEQPRLVKQEILHWVGRAQTPDTRQQRITGIAKAAAKGMVPRPFR